MEGLPSAKTIKFEILQLDQTLLSRPSFCNEKLLSKAYFNQYSLHEIIIDPPNPKIFFLYRGILVRHFISRA